MTFVRRTLRVIAAAWLAFQPASLVAFLPQDCCASHRSAGTTREASTPGAHCPMRGADGRACPMHRAAAGDEAPATATGCAHHDRGPASVPAECDCRMSGTCDRPVQALMVLLSSPGILPAASAGVPAPDRSSVSTPAVPAALDRFGSPDLPPPRA